MFRQPVLVYAAGADALAKARTKALARGLAIAVYTEEMFKLATMTTIELLSAPFRLTSYVFSVSPFTVLAMMSTGGSRGCLSIPDSAPAFWRLDHSAPALRPVPGTGPSRPGRSAPRARACTRGPRKSAVRANVAGARPDRMWRAAPTQVIELSQLIRSRWSPVGCLFLRASWVRRRSGRASVVCENA